MSFYPPGSTFKVIQGLIGMQEGVLSPSQTYPCHGGYPYGRGVKCHAHGSPLDLEAAIAELLQRLLLLRVPDIIENKKYGDIEEGFGVWADYVRSFGYGRKLGTDFTGELNGNVPSSEFYDKAYRGRWNGLTVISLSIGQGELGCTPLQMANMVATVANRGHYRTPHVVKRIHDRDSIDARFYVNHTPGWTPAGSNRSSKGCTKPSTAAERAASRWCRASISAARPVRLRTRTGPTTAHSFASPRETTRR